MQIWVDADACPNVIKEILFRAAARLGVALTLVANKPLRIPPSPHIRTVQVPAGFDVADNRIAAEMQAGDLVITADIPLAADVLERGGHALDPRGGLFTRDNIEESLTMRKFMDELRNSGVETGGPPPFSQSDRQAFANQLDRILTRHHQKKSDAENRVRQA
ncbi:MAG TPA: YaiI/YqxD family protein [Burkholderiales bacterium]|nr:YaiI/YqxD family protein [Burkholderiales bacterium]